LVRDRILHHAIFSIINPIFEPTFIATSFSCRVGYGSHKGVAVLESMLRRSTRNYTRLCFALKCDIKKFFDSVDHEVLLEILKRRIKDPDTIWLLERIITSFGPRRRERERDGGPRLECGIPIGNLTSQLFANIYMNEFDQFVKHDLRVENYVRYTDDFVMLAESRDCLDGLLSRTNEFLQTRLKLTLHPKKIEVRTAYQGVDFLGYVIFPRHRLLRTKTRQRVFKKLQKRSEDQRSGKISADTFKQSLKSYLGVLSHADAHELSKKIRNQFGIFGK
ncbi:MAG: RNA-dependent DNA polymerase, partial [Candidatus Pacebacteria bacterium CG10_big_fil_rev_8_21_14_0_10_45_6]